MIKKFLNGFRNYLLFKWRFPWVRIGKDVHCQAGVYFWSPRRDIVIGNHVGIGFRCLFQCDISIGDKVLIASDVAFINCDDHRYDIIGKAIWDSGRIDGGRIDVEDDVWIGHGAIVLSPVRVGRGSIVAAGSVVCRDVPRYSIVAGVPAKVLKPRFSPEQIALHEELLMGRKIQAVEDKEDGPCAF